MSDIPLPFLRSFEDRFFNLNSYLRLAYLSISIAAKPLHASEILSIAERYGLMPNHLFGATQIKTLNARLAEDIISQGEESLFFRTAPAVYYLRHLSPIDDPSRAFEIYNAVRREKGIKNEDVLVAPKNELEKHIFGKFVNLSEPQFIDIYNSLCSFKNRHLAENDTTVKQFVTYTTLRNESRYLVYRRGKYSNKSEHLRNTLSIAVGGHVTTEDFTLFNYGYEALIENSSRELLEELDTFGNFASIDEIKSLSQFKGFINVDDNSDARQHIAAVVAVNYPMQTAPSSGELGITDINWYELEELKKYRSYFDLWSGMIVDSILENKYA